MFEGYPDVLTVRQVQQMLQLGRDNTYNLVRCGQIPSMQFGRQIRIRKADLIAFLEKQQKAS